MQWLTASVIYMFTVVDKNKFVLSSSFLYHDIAVYRIREHIFRSFVNCLSFRLLWRTNWVEVVDPKEMCRPNTFRSFFMYRNSARISILIWNSCKLSIFYKVCSSCTSLLVLTVLRRVCKSRILWISSSETSLSIINLA